MATKITASRKVVEDYRKLFVNRRAYTMQSLRPHPESGRHYYFRPSRKGTDTSLMLTDETIRRHLEGEITSACTPSIRPLSAVNGLPSMPTTSVPWRTC